MDHERANERSLNLDLYAESQSWIGALKSHLPEDAVTSLSKEVLRRLKERGSVVVHQSPLDEQIDHLCDALLSDDDQAGARIIEAARTDGASMEQVYLRYLGRAAEVLGQRWEDDLVSFTRMTLGTNRMYAIICTLRRQLRSPPLFSEKAAVFVAVPGETHTLGIQMATDLFRQDGWEIDLLIDRSHDEIMARLSDHESDIIGISASGDHSMDGLSRLVISIRIVKPQAYIFLSGSVLDEAAEKIDLLNLDGVARDFDGAMALMDQLGDMRPQDWRS